MELLDLLGEKNGDIKRAIQFLLDLEDFKFKESSCYKRKQRFTKNYKHIAYCSQREHAIDWLFSKALWEKSKNENIQLKTIIKDIKCTPLLVYLLIVTGELDESEAKSIEIEIKKELDGLVDLYSPIKIISEEKKILIKIIGNYRGNARYKLSDLADAISNKLSAIN